MRFKNLQLVCRSLFGGFERKVRADYNRFRHGFRTLAARVIQRDDRPILKRDFRNSRKFERSRNNGQS